MPIYRNEEGRWIMSTNNPDIVEVVRCKDCIYYNANWCTYWEDMDMQPTDFCSKAERKEDE